MSGNEAAVTRSLFMDKNVKNCERQVHVGEKVIYFDEFGKEHTALTTAVWGDRYEVIDDNGGSTLWEPSINLLFVSPDEKREDSYGRQVERRSSCCPVSVQSAWGNCYCLPEQLDEARLKITEAKKQFANI
jgi:hypothetical protein